MKVFLDTHVLLWLFQRNKKMLSKRALNIIDNSDLFFPNFSYMELQFLYEVEKIKIQPEEVLSDLKENININLLHTDTFELIQQSIRYQWTHDPFDRLIVSEADFYQSYLLTRDKLIQKEFSKALW